MASSVVITVKVDKSQADVQRLLELETNKDRRGILAVAQLMRALASKTTRGIVTVQTAATAPVAASTTATLVSVAADDTIVIGGTTLTAKASPSGESQWSQAGSDTADAASLAACINAHSTLKLLVSATSAAGVVTITCKTKGIIGNQVPVTRTGTAITLGAATLTGGTGGAQDTPVVYSAGIA